MDPNNNREEREEVDRVREGERIRHEAAKKSKEYEDRGSNNEEEKEEELTFIFPIYDIPTTLVGK